MQLNGNVPIEGANWSELITVNSFGTLLPAIPDLQELDGETVLAVDTWDIGGNILNLKQITVSTGI